MLIYVNLGRKQQFMNSDFKYSYLLKMSINHAFKLVTINLFIISISASNTILVCNLFSPLVKQKTYGDGLVQVY